MTATRPQQPNFDLIARPYRWLEYLTMGRALERCREHFLPQLSDRTHAFVLGDGDGRFLSRLLVSNPTLYADAVDTSTAMLRLLRNRCEAEGPRTSTRLTIHQADALDFAKSIPPSQYDLVTTHFFLDCLTQAEIETLAYSVASKLAPNAIWVVSDFRIPPGAMRIPASILVQTLYLAFRILTGLRTRRLPDHVTAFEQAGLSLISSNTSLFGLLIAELWTNGPSIHAPRSSPAL